MPTSLDGAECKYRQRQQQSGSYEIREPGHAGCCGPAIWAPSALPFFASLLEVVTSQAPEITVSPRYKWQEKGVCT